MFYLNAESEAREAVKEIKADKEYEIKSAEFYITDE